MKAILSRIPSNQIRINATNPIALKNQIAVKNSIQNTFLGLGDVVIDNLVNNAVPQYKTSDSKIHLDTGVVISDQGLF